MQIENRKHWIDQIMDNVSDYELTAMFADLTEFRRTALLKPESTVRALDRIFRKQCGQSDTMLRVVEDAVLYEMARRYNNANEDNRAAAIERWKTQGFREVLLYKDEASTPILTYWVFADNADNLTRDTLTAKRPLGNSSVRMDTPTETMAPLSSPRTRAAQRTNSQKFLSDSESTRREEG